MVVQIHGVSNCFLIMFIGKFTENLYGDLLKKFQNEGKASPIDVDIVRFNIYYYKKYLY